MVRQYAVRYVGDGIELVEYYTSMASLDRILGTLLDSNSVKFGQEDILDPCFDEDELRRRNSSVSRD